MRMLQTQRMNNLVKLKVRTSLLTMSNSATLKLTTKMRSQMRNWTEKMRMLQTQRMNNLGKLKVRITWGS